MHFLREALRRSPPSLWLRLQAIHHLLFAALLASAAASRRRAEAFDGIPFTELATAYAEHLGRLFLHEPELRFSPPSALLRLFGIDRDALARSEDPSVVSVAAAEAAVERAGVHVTAL